MVDWCQSKKIPLTEDQVIASHYVESRGMRFFIEFGYENVVSRADELFNLECEKALEVGLLN